MRRSCRKCQIDRMQFAHLISADERKEPSIFLWLLDRTRRWAHARTYCRCPPIPGNSRCPAGKVPATYRAGPGWLTSSGYFPSSALNRGCSRIGSSLGSRASAPAENIAGWDR